MGGDATGLGACISGATVLWGHKKSKYTGSQK